MIVEKYLFSTFFQQFLVFLRSVVQTYLQEDDSLMNIPTSRRIQSDATYPTFFQTQNISRGVSVSLYVYNLYQRSAWLTRTFSTE